MQMIFCSNKLLCLIQSNKRSSHRHELYSERVRIVRWFEKHHLNEFSFTVTIGINRRRQWHHGFGERFSIMDLGRGFLLKPFSSYKGLVESKHEVYQKFKFSLCFENVADISGYITEKIFDSMLAGSVPFIEVQTIYPTTSHRIALLITGNLIK